MTSVRGRAQAGRSVVLRWAQGAAGLEALGTTLCGQKPWAWMLLSSGVLAVSPMNCGKDNVTYFLGFCENKLVLFVEQLEQ